jgi:hypothetical protein
MKCCQNGTPRCLPFALLFASLLFGNEANATIKSSIPSPREIVNSSDQAQIKLSAGENKSNIKASSAVARSSGAFSRARMLSVNIEKSQPTAPQVTRVEKIKLEPHKPAATIRHVKSEPVVTPRPPVKVVEIDARKKPDNFIARLVLHLPESLLRAEETLHNVTTKALCLTSVAADPKFLQAAWISFDAGKQLWQATWPKPPLFNYGMILLPALVERMNAGDAFSFKSQGKAAVLSKNECGQLLVEQDGLKKTIGSKDLRDLLQDKIDADGLSLYLDKSGNLILQAVGPRAMAMAGMNGKR